MDGIRGSEQPPVYHERDPAGAGADAADPDRAGTARLFMLVQEDTDDNDVPVRDVVAYGMALPGGHVLTVHPSGRGISNWRSPESASRRLDSELVWLR
ncbi:hypothetical protein DPM19_19615 [Actinomadura craniellae]|uniref:Uncharacterized protein n=1 Tax=Actinomadura craniellae TaxID=2231787 RepID=A0A365H2H2_9ACTN|nr:hypothetical protein [Actinomadura craniellae]RAY13297.1 hypothetical protein DPM19_19615 [Actinomadura craniellae]